MGFNLRAMKEEQIKLAKKVILRNDFEEIKYIAGISSTCTEKKIVSAIVVLDYSNLEQIEFKYSIKDLTMPSISGYGTYRSAEAIIEAYSLLNQKPDLIMFDGNGILHPRKIGVASHLGILLDLPTIGVSRKMSCGIVDKGRILIQNDLRGYVLETKKNAKPVFVSPGHRIGFKKTQEIVEYTSKGNKLPVPLHLAHKIAVKMKKQLGTDLL